MNAAPLSYLGKPRLKARLLREITKHEKADQIIAGTYGRVDGRVWKGCAIGCALRSLNHIQKINGDTSRHDRLVAEVGWPLELAYHIDHVFEHLPTKVRKSWPRRVATAIPVGVDLSGVMPALLQWMILDPTNGLIATALTDPQRAAWIEFARLVALDWTGQTVTSAEWIVLEDRLDDTGAWARARAGAGAGAWAGAWTWAWAGAGARAGAGAWAWAGDTNYVMLANQTLRLLRAAGRKPRT